MSSAERGLGIDSFVSFTNTPTESKPGEILSEDDSLDADIHVIHSHLPDGAKGKTIFIPHGTPEHCFTQAIEQNKASGCWAGDPFMLSIYRVNNTDVTVTFWDRHKYIWKSICPKASIITVPMGIDKEFWKPVESRGKWVGDPSLFTCENSHAIKWPLDIILAFPLIMSASSAILHIHYLPLDQHKWWYPLMFSNGVSYKSFSSGNYFDKETLRNAFVSVDYYISPVRYGDFNSVCLEAKSSGCKVISYKGNPYADYWLEEGSQIDMANRLLDIINGKVEKRNTLEVPNLHEMTNEMVKIYKELI